MSRPELTLLLHRLRQMADTHDAAAEEDYYADTADAHSFTAAREPFLCGALLREAIAAIEVRCD